MIRRPSRLPLAALMAGIGLLLAGLSGCASGTGATAATAPSPPLTIGSAPTGGAVPGNFLGLSMEYRGLAAYAGTDPRAIDPAFVNLLSSLAPGGHPLLRVGGDSTDWSWWPVRGIPRPGGVKLDLTPRALAVAKAVVQAIHGKLILGVNLEADNPRIASAEARAFASHIGRQSIAALEVGNEAELYATFSWYRNARGRGVPGRAAGYSFQDMLGDFSRTAAVLPNLPLAGPSSGSPPWLATLGTFLRAEPRVRIATVHAYPLKHCNGSAPVTESQLLSNAASDGLAQTVTPYVAAAHGHGIPLRVDETNAITCGGTRGISNTYGSALWAIDAMFALARAGVDGINVHTVPGTINEILGPSFSHGQWSVVVHPEFYGLLMFAQAAPAGSHLVAVAGTPPPGVKVWATTGPDHAERIVVINKLSRRAITLPLRVPAGRGPAVAESLRGRSLFASSSVSLGGQTFGNATTTGRLAAPDTTTLTPAGGVFPVTVPAASATLLTIPTR